MGLMAALITLLIGSSVIFFIKEKPVAFYTERYRKALEQPTASRVILALVGAYIGVSSLIQFRYGFAAAPLSLIEGLFWIGFAFYHRHLVRFSGTLTLIALALCAFLKFSSGTALGAILYSALFYALLHVWLAKLIVQKYSHAQAKPGTPTVRTEPKFT